MPDPPTDRKRRGTPADADFAAIPESLRSTLRMDLRQRQEMLASVKRQQAREQAAKAAREAKIHQQLGRAARTRPANPNSTGLVNQPGRGGTRKAIKGKQLESLPKQKQALELRIAGLTQAEISRKLGVPTGTVGRWIHEWVKSQKPSDELVAESRRVFTERLERLHEAHWDRAMGLHDEAGNWLEEPSLESGEFCLKVLDRAAKLNGVDLPQTNTTLLISAESIAAYLGWDPQGERYSAVVDVEPTGPPFELEAGQ